VTRTALGLALLAIAACGGDGDLAAADDPCAAVVEWQTAMADATNGYSRASRDASSADERRDLYLGAFEELESLTDELRDDLAGEPDVVAAIDVVSGIIEDRHAQAAELDDGAYAVLGVPGGGLFTASERARATVLSAARPLC
jgi:hypothetical protein